MKSAWKLLLVMVLACGGGDGNGGGAGGSGADRGGGGEEDGDGEGDDLGVEPAPTANKLELGVTLEGHSGALIERVPEEACSEAAPLPGKPTLDDVLSALAESQGRLQGCYNAARREHDSDNTGVTVAIDVQFSQSGCVERAIVADDNALTPGFTMCLLDIVREWSIPAYQERSRHRFSLDLGPPPADG